MSCPCTNSQNPGYSTNNYSLPFNVEYTSNNSNKSQTQTICNTNMCLLPNGPSIPTRPIFPSALPAEYRPSTTSIDTNYLNVKKVGCICNLRANCLSVDGGGENSTTIQFRNLPTIDSENDKISNLVIDGDGNIFRSVVKPVTAPKNMTHKIFHDKHSLPPHINPYESDDSQNINHRYFMNQPGN